MRQAHTRFQVQAALVGAAMELGLVHGGEQFAVGLALLLQVKDAGDATHSLFGTVHLP